MYCDTIVRPISNEISLASSAKDPSSLFQSLSSYGLSDTPDARVFVTELFSRAPRTQKHKQKKDSGDSRKKSEKESQALRTQKFGFLLDEEEPAVEISTKRKSKGKEKERKSEVDPEAHKREKKDRHTRKRENDGNNWESDEEEKAHKRRREDSVEVSNLVNSSLIIHNLFRTAR